MFEELQKLGDAAFELRVFALPEFVGRDIDVEVGIGPIILDLPAHIGEPVRELGLRGYTAIRQTVPRRDADNAAQVLRPISGPAFFILKVWENMSPSDPANSLVSATIGPAGHSRGTG